MSFPFTKPGQEENSGLTSHPPESTAQSVSASAHSSDAAQTGPGTLSGTLSGILSNAVAVRTHPLIDPAWVGAAVHVAEGSATARLHTRPEMVADERGLVHGGFTFGLADYAAMLAVNDPFVVLGAASTRFLAPVSLGQTMLAQAQVLHTQGKKRMVQVEVHVETGSGPQKVFEGEFTCFVLTQHVLGPAPSPSGTSV